MTNGTLVDRGGSEASILAGFHFCPLHHLLTAIKKENGVLQMFPVKRNNACCDLQFLLELIKKFLSLEKTLEYGKIIDFSENRQKKPGLYTSKQQGIRY